MMTTEDEVPEPPVEVTAAPDGPEPKDYDKQPLAEVINMFMSPFSMETGVFGVDGRTRNQISRMTGHIEQSDVDRTLRRFVHPDGFDHAGSQLHSLGVVVLCARSGVGKRSSAIALLREAGANQIFALSPRVTLADLSSWDFHQGSGYLVIDRRDDQESPDSDFDWRLVSSRLRDREALMVVTTTRAPRSDITAVPHLGWCLPDPTRTLRAYWPEEWQEEHRELLTSELASCTTVEDIVRLADRLAAGEDPGEAVSHFDNRLSDDVTRWFDAEPSRREVAEITTLAFANGLGERALETASNALLERLHDHMREAEQHPDQAAAAETSMPQRRASLNRNDLIVSTRVPTELGTSTSWTFKQRGHQRHVLRQLWIRMEVAYWDAVGDWLDDIVVLPVYEQKVALGLAELATTAIDEVTPVIDGWAAGTQGAAGQRAAVYTLWLMAYDPSLAPAALKIANQWITRGNPPRRWSGAMAFAGRLGIRYPHDAVRKLWQVYVQSHTTTGDVERVLAMLFGTLVDNTPDAGIVLSVLAKKLSHFSEASGKTRMRSIAVNATLAVLSARETSTNRSLFITFLLAHPDRRELLARLWAEILCHRPLRLRAMNALRSNLEDLANHDNANDQAREFGEALACALAPDERRALESEFQIVLSRKGKDMGPVVEAMLAALSRET